MTTVIVIFILQHCDVMEGEGGGLKLYVTMMLWFSQMVWTSPLTLGCEGHS